ncbi:MAG: hypothetical protein U0V48_09895 [Anaerolineales bacterium]
MQRRKRGMQTELVVQQQQQVGNLDVWSRQFVKAAIVASHRRDNIERVPAAAQKDDDERVR